MTTLIPWVCHCEMVGPCEHNQICVHCGNGWGSDPCPCKPKLSNEQHKELLEKSLVIHKIIFDKLSGTHDNGS